MRYVLILWSLLATLPLFAQDEPRPQQQSQQQPQQAAAPAEQLLVYFEDDGSSAAKQFANETLPFLRELASAENLELTVSDPREGSPAEVTISPLVVFQNHRGRSIYQGRTTTPERIRTFVETSRWVPQNADKLKREDVILRKIKRATIASPIKIAPVSGKAPRGYDEAAFQQEMRSAIDDGLRFSKLVPSLEQGRGDRAFYMDFYPWVSDKGTMYLSYALFSQFHCKKPVFFSSEAEKFSGPWRKREDLFTQAATRLEAEVLKQLSRDLGDGFVPVGGKTAVTAWPPLPAAPTNAAAATADIELVRQWVADPDAAGPPPILFQFPAPVDQYRGKITGLAAELAFDEALSVASLRGAFTADPKSIDMGEADLNDALQGKSFLESKTFPTATFTIDEVESDYALAFGTLATFTMRGTFQLKGKKIPLTVVGDLEPAVLSASWSLDFSPWKIEQADGPTPQRHTLNFDLQVTLKPKPPKP